MATIAIGSDHAGRALKDYIRNNLKEHLVEDCGTKASDSVDYPDFAEKVVHLLHNKKADLGILICGTGLGMSIAANKYNGIRAAHVESVFTARMAKEHNDANVLCIGERVTGSENALLMVRTWLESRFGGDGDDSVRERHTRRIAKIHAAEE